MTRDFWKKIKNGITSKNALMIRVAWRVTFSKKCKFGAHSILVKKNFQFFFRRREIDEYGYRDLLEPICESTGRQILKSSKRLFRNLHRRRYVYLKSGRAAVLKYGEDSCEMSHQISRCRDCSKTNFESNLFPLHVTFLPVGRKTANHLQM